MAVYLDTHVVVWLYAGDLGRFPAEVTARIDADEVLISPIVLLELQYLRETGRITVEGPLIVECLAQAVGLALCDQPFARVVAESVQQKWTRDPFDRLIVAQAITRNAPLITKDQTILAHYPRALW